MMQGKEIMYGSLATIVEIWEEYILIIYNLKYEIFWIFNKLQKTRSYP